MDVVFASALYFGSLGLAFALLGSATVRRRWKILVLGIAVQVALHAGVMWLKGSFREDGYREWYWADFYHIPVNVVGALYYIGVATVRSRSGGGSSGAAPG